MQNGLFDICVRLKGRTKIRQMYRRNNRVTIANLLNIGPCFRDRNENMLKVI